jgi:hypothetical protein
MRQQNTGGESGPAHFSVIPISGGVLWIIPRMVLPARQQRNAGKGSVLSSFGTANGETDAENPQVNR